MPVPKRAYSDDEVKAILARAIDRQRASAPHEGLSHDDLLAVARDAGIPPEAIEAAAAEVASQREQTADEVAVRKERQSDFRIHLYTYLPVMAFLVFVNVMTAGRFGGYPWVLWPLVGWGLALALHARFALFPTDVEIAHDARHLAERRRKLEEKKRRREALRQVDESARELGHAIERGVGAILGATAKRIHEHVDAASDTRESEPQRVRVDGGRRVAGDEGDEEPMEEHEQERRPRRGEKGIS